MSKSKDERELLEFMQLVDASGGMCGYLREIAADVDSMATNLESGGTIAAVEIYQATEKLSKLGEMIEQLAEAEIEMQIAEIEMSEQE